MQKLYFLDHCTSVLFLSWEMSFQVWGRKLTFISVKYAKELNTFNIFLMMGYHSFPFLLSLFSIGFLNEHLLQFKQNCPLSVYSYFDWIPVFVALCLGSRTYILNHLQILTYWIIYGLFAGKTQQPFFITYSREKENWIKYLVYLEGIEGGVPCPNFLGFFFLSKSGKNERGIWRPVILFTTLDFPLSTVTINEEIEFPFFI